MTLLAELRSLDLSGIVDARASIRVAVNAPDLQALLEGGAAQTALAGLGNSLQQLRTGLDSPEALLRPLVDSVAGLSPALDLRRLPLERYLGAVREGSTLLASLFEGLDGDPAVLGRQLGFSLDSLVQLAEAVSGSYTRVGLHQVSRLRGLIETVERGVPTDPARFADLAVEVLVPLPRARLKEIRGAVSGVLEGAGAISLPSSRSVGLVAALEGVAAATADPAALRRALTELERVRLHTVGQIRGDLLEVFAAINRLQVGRALEPLLGTGDLFRNAEEDVLAFLEKWRTQIAGVRGTVENLTGAEVRALLEQVLDFLEEQARLRIAEPIEAQIRRLEQWLRGLLRHLPLRELRSEVSAFIFGIAATIREADLDAPARAVRRALAEVRAALDAPGLADDVRAALEQAEAAIDAALDEVITALETIGARIEAVAGEAEGILLRAAEALTAFRAALDGVTAAVDALGVEQAVQQVVDTLRTLRETAERVLTVAPLPEPLRPTIEQMIAVLEGIDLERVFAPVEAAVAEFRVPPPAALTEALQEVQRTLENLIPAELIASIEAEIDAALAVVRGFDPAPLLAGVGTFLEEAAELVEGLDPRPHVSAIRAPFLALLEAVDRVHPRILLQPVIEAYDSLLGNIEIPAPQAAVARASETVSGAGDRLARAALEPIRALAPAGSIEIVQPGTEVAGETPAIETVRAGDVVRLFGYLPARLREALAAMDAGAAGEALRTADALCGGLARDLRRLQATVWEIEVRLHSAMDELLRPLAAAQLRAQLSLRASASIEGAELDIALDAVALAGPGAMREELAEALAMVSGRVGSAGVLGGTGVGGMIESAAATLERCRFARLAGDLDALLAALDPEPIAAELDALVEAALRKAPELIGEIGAELQQGIGRIEALIRDYNPGAQVQRFLVVLDVLREQLDLLDPRQLAAELGEVHAAIRATIAAYDPALFAEEVAQTLAEIATGLRALDPAALLGDLSLFDELADRVEAAVPTRALAGVGGSLEEVGRQLAALDPAGLLASIEALGPRLLEEFRRAVEAIRREIVALLEAIRFASASARVSATVEVG